MLHVGCGPIKLEGYVNIDISPSHEPDICGDILTMDFNEVDAIYSCHMIEHLSVPDAAKAFGLFHKWLKYGAVLRLAVPSLALAAQAYVNGSDMKFLYGAEFKGYYLHDTPCERFNFFMKEWDHRLTYDFRQMQEMLFRAGFRFVFQREANESVIPNFNHDRFIPESLYLEAIK